MDRMTGKIRRWLLSFLGVHELCTYRGAEIYKEIAQKLLVVPRVFGDKKRLVVGRGVILNDALINTNSGRVVLGDYVFCGHNVSFLTGTHDYSKTGVDRQAAIPQQGRDIVVGEGVWIGSNATILGPCQIGCNSVIAAGAVVIGGVEENCIFAGVPARKVKDVFRG